MNLGIELEYFNLAIWFDRKTLHAMVQALVEAGVSVTWKESPEQFHLLVITTDGKSEWILQRLNGSYKLHLVGVPIPDTGGVGPLPLHREELRSCPRQNHH
jgi:hypothetical protein